MRTCLSWNPTLTNHWYMPPIARRGAGDCTRGYRAVLGRGGLGLVDLTEYFNPPLPSRVAVYRRTGERILCSFKTFIVLFKYSVPI